MLIHLLNFGKPKPKLGTCSDPINNYQYQPVGALKYRTSRIEKMILAKADIKLETKLVGFVEEKFYIPSFQRGYRWRQDEVRGLVIKPTSEIDCIVLYITLHNLYYGTQYIKY